MEMPQDDGSIRRNALQRLRDSFANQMLDAEALQSSMERDNPMLAQIREGAVSGGVMPIGSLSSAVKGGTQGLANAVKGTVERANTGFGGIVNAPAKVLEQTASLPKPARIDPRQLLKIYDRFK